MDCVCFILNSLLKVAVGFVLLTKAWSLVTIGKCKSKNRVDGKVVILTGATSGIGKEVARELLKRGARVILACRNVNKAAEIANEFKAENPGARFSVKHLDLCNLSSVRIFANEILKEEEKLDTLINNAGMLRDDFKMTIDGFEEIFQINFLGSVLLTDLLLPLLKSSAPSRIINVGSMAHCSGKIDPSNFEASLSSGFKASRIRYSNAKLAKLMWTRAMAVELEKSGVTINALHPGVVWTAFASGSLTFMNMFLRLLIYIYGRTAKEGAQTILHLCLDPSGGEENGEFWMECGKKYSWIPHNAEAEKSILDIARRVLQDKKHQ